MKKILAIAVLAISTMTIYAQEDSKLTVNAGFGFSSVVGDDADTKNIFSYKIGLTYDFDITENFYIIPGIELVSKGCETENIAGDISMTYLQIPVLAAYRFNLSDDLNLKIKAGPYASYGIYGSDIELYDGTEINIFDDEGGYERLDAGIIAGISFDFNRFSIGAEYSRGLMKLDSDYKQYNQTYGITFGYKF